MEDDMSSNAVRRALFGMLSTGASALLLALVPDPIGSGLSDGIHLLYEADGARQSPWVYDSVRVVHADVFDRCVLIDRRGQAPRTSCARGDTLFERVGDGEYRPARPIGERMTLTLPGRNGSVLTFTTGVASTTRVGALELRELPTTIITVDSTGVPTRRLTERYAPALLTALAGTFETPHVDEGWRVASRFVLVEVDAGRE
jgi:hypothetical protein